MGNFFYVLKEIMELLIWAFLEISGQKNNNERMGQLTLMIALKMN